MNATTFMHLQVCRRMATGVVRALVLVTLFAAAGATAQPVRVMPVTPAVTSYASGPSQFTVVGDAVYFDQWSGLWKTDGTAAGTVLVAKVYADHIWGRTASGNRLFFVGQHASDQAGTRGLWVSDGTLAGTQLVKAGEPRGITDVNGTVFFTMDSMLYKTDGTPTGTVVVKNHTGAEPVGLANAAGVLLYATGGNLWRSDGTDAGTTLVKSFTAFQGGIVHGGKLYFSASDAVSGGGLWVSDGALGGTVLLSAVDNPGAFASIGPHLYFSAETPGAGREMFRTDGTGAGTVLVADVEPGPAGSFPGFFTPYGDSILFSAETPGLGRELWKTDGTAAGTALLKDIAPGSSFGQVNHSYPSSFAPASGGLCFKTYLSNALWRTDGTEAGTIEILPSFGLLGGYANLVSMGSRVYFSTRSANKVQIWSTDCSGPAGSVLLKEIEWPANGTSDVTYSMTSMGDHLLLRSNTAAEGNELWRVDAGGGSLVKEVEPGEAGGLEFFYPDYGNLSDPRPPHVRPWAKVGDTFYFRGVTTAHGGELWRSDGTAAGTALVKDIFPGSQSEFIYFYQGSLPDELTAVGSTLYFVAEDGVHGRELWKSDGTEAGTVMVKEIIPEPWYGPVGLTAVNGTLYFQAHDDVNGYELWKSDGTAAGTTVIDLVPGSGSSNAYPVANLGGSLMFCANAPGGEGLFKTDGTLAGTFLVKEGACGLPAVVMNGVLYFVQSGFPLPTRRLWRSDGTTAGTYEVFTTTATSLDRLTVIGNSLYFWSQSYSGSAVWKSDGTTAGTLQLRTFGGGQPLQDFEKYGFVALNGIVYFTAVDFQGTGYGLWRTDGTPAGTYAVDLFPGFKSSHPSELTVLGDRLYFLADDGLNPRSLYYYVPKPPSQEITRLGNLSSRTQVMTGDNVMIGGFVIGGPFTKCVAIVATGPSLTQFGISGPLQDPRLTLVRSSDQAVIATNDDWQAAPASPCLQAEAFAPTDPKEARIVAELPPGAYTAIVQGASDADMGVAVLGIYEIDKPNVPLVNISARAHVAGGEQQMIGGFVIQGTLPQTVAVVATGPSLGGFGIANPLSDPVLTIVRQSDGAVVTTNDNWLDAPNAVDLDGAGFAPSHPQEAAILVTLPPGAYTAIVQGAGGAAGIGVVGIYRVN